MGAVSAARPVPDESSPFSVSLKEHFGLWVITISGILLIFCFGFGNDWGWMKSLVTRVLRVPELSPSESWELGAITWSLLFGA